MRFTIVNIRRLIIISAVIALFGGFIINFIFNSLTSIIPNIYLHLIEGSFNAPVGLIGMLPKLIYVPLYIMSLRYLKIEEDIKSKQLYLIGIYSYMFRLISIQNIILDRLGYLFVLLSIFPLYLYWVKLVKEKKNIEFIISMFIPVTLFLLKVIVFPEKEYLYNSVFYQSLLTFDGI